MFFIWDDRILQLFRSARTDKQRKSVNGEVGWLLV
jgi:hypothetical protein